MIKPRQHHAKEASFDLTPMIDVVMLLIVFFTMTAQFNATDLRPIDLPRNRGEEHPDANLATVTVDIDAQGRMWVAGEMLDPVRFASDMRVAKAKAGAEPRVVVRADRTLPARAINDVVRALHVAGISRWSLATAGEGGGGGGGDGGDGGDGGAP
jgi:biopolymer transport protein ExbD